MGKKSVGNDLKTIGGAAAAGLMLGGPLGAAAGGALGTGFVLARRAFGDTARPFAGGMPGGLPGAAGLTVTSGQRSWGLGGLGSDHDTGRAADLIGPNLNAYKLNLERMGGFAEFHGQGGDRHLHAVGDTPRPRPSGMGTLGGESPIVVNFHGDVIVNSDVDLEAAVRSGINKARRDERERTDRSA